VKHPAGVASRQGTTTPTNSEEETVPNTSSSSGLQSAGPPTAPVIITAAPAFSRVGRRVTDYFIAKFGECVLVHGTRQLFLDGARAFLLSDEVALYPDEETWRFAYDESERRYRAWSK
jgi:hypothetical protein